MHQDPRYIVHAPDVHVSCDLYGICPFSVCELLVFKVTPVARMELCLNEKDTFADISSIYGCC